MNSDWVEAAVRITEAYLAQVSPGQLGIPMDSSPEEQGAHLGRIYAKIYEAVLEAPKQLD